MLENDTLYGENGVQTTEKSSFLNISQSDYWYARVPPGVWGLMHSFETLGKFLLYVVSLHSMKEVLSSWQIKILCIPCIY